ncbi:MAG: DUF3899 domain-containing protein [Lachnospiraceae bacterium]|nr:DUF3899 domain-containing protein [Lachnospiraceae bacterium]
MNLPEESPLKKWTPYLILIPSGLALTALVSWMRGFSFQGDIIQNSFALSDGFFVTGVMFAGVGSLVWVSTTGFFDLLSYGFANLAAFTVFRREKNAIPFYEYKEEKRAKRKKARFEILLIGIGFILVAGVFLTLYFKSL